MLQFKHKKNEKNVQIVQREVRMKKLLYRPKDAWVGDLIPYYENGTFYGYYLHDPRIRDKEYAEETTWHLVTTKDFVLCMILGIAIGTYSSIFFCSMLVDFWNDKQQEQVKTIA